MSEFRPWQCSIHPNERRCRTDGTCASCWADRNGLDYELRPVRDPKADPHPLETAIAKLGEAS